MSKQSDTSNVSGALALDYLILPGWVQTVQPPGLAHGGVSIKVAEQDNARGLLCLIDPWPDSVFAVLAVFDRVNLHLNGDTRPVDGKTIALGEENDRVALYVPVGALRDGVNQLHYEVIRVSGNRESSNALNVLFYRPGPTSLRLVLPADVVRDGVSAARAAQGVICECHYSTPHAYDTVRLTGNSATDSRTVVAGQNSPILFTLYTDFFRRAGDNPAAPFFFVAEDQLGNRAQSATVNIDIHLDRVDLDLRPPVVLEAREAGGTRLNFQKDFYEADFATVTVNYTGSAPGQTVKLYAIGRANTYGSEIQTVQATGQTLTFRVPRLEVVDSIGSRMTFYYTVRLPSTSEDKESRSLGVDVTAQPLRLPEPTLNAGRNNARVYYPALVGEYRVRLRLYGVVIRNSDEIYINRPDYMDIAIPRDWLTENMSRDVIFNYTLRKTGTSELIQFSWCLRVQL
ncbi:hypothetical protein [Pseudomonas sp. dw_612]|uniref:hypothetical protein n=1 Tax=Pseudomonas sp. dw_612 TaxID=2720080 RepID=UPI001BD680B0|nr:hypothetical protein [Pseudomonas sp. dw_612]